jgi:hypothetical protein
MNAHALAMTGPGEAPRLAAQCHADARLSDWMSSEREFRVEWVLCRKACMECATRGCLELWPALHHLWCC